MRNYRNIYQTARELKGLTQEAAAERLDAHKNAVTLRVAALKEQA